MRTIKFRAWITEAKQMIEHNSIDFNDFLHKTDLLGNINHSYCGDDFALMQFTGLHDKNGKEIYEGDIVSYKRNVGNWTGESLTTIHKIIFTEEINAFVMKDNSGYIKLRKHWGYEYEVIGNIYENA